LILSKTDEAIPEKSCTLN